MAKRSPNNSKALTKALVGKWFCDEFVSDSTHFTISFSNDKFKVRAVDTYDGEEGEVHS